VSSEVENRSASVFRAPAKNFSVPDAGYPLGKRVCVKEKTCAAASHEESVPASVVPILHLLCLRERIHGCLTGHGKRFNE
jgi:hypothetical protein